MIGATSALAQTTPVETLIRQHERAVQDVTRRESLGVDSLSPETDAGQTTPRTKPQAGACRVIRTIRLDGHPDAMGAQPQALFSAYLGQCLVAEEINALLGDLNSWFQRKGWTTTRVYAAEQDINGGELVLRVVAGRIEGYRYIDKEADERLAYAFPQEPAGYLNLRDLEQGLENLNRVPSQEAKFQLYPGKEPGTSVVVVEMTEKPRTRWTEMVDNSGNASMGHWRSNTEFAIDNLLGRNDQLAIGYNRNLDGGTLGSTFEGLTANYNLSSGNHLWGTSLALFRTDFTLPGINQNYLLQTRSKKMGVSYEYLLTRDQSSKFSFIAGLDFTHQRSYTQDINIDSQYRRLAVAYAGIKGKQYFGNNILDWQLRADQGTGLIDAMSRIPGGTDPRYWAHKAQANLTVPLPKNKGIWRTSFQAQDSQDNTPTLGQMYVGSRYNVRGYQDHSLYGATGAWLRNDLESSPVRVDQVNLTPYVGYDAGHIKSNAQQQVSQHHVTGMAVGMRMDWGKVKADLAYTRALSRPEEFVNESRSRWLAHLSIAL
ncbi:ShlB/FhaC/HecB family hemolysin secretion/activation protein [Limnohabitans curvus]|uniref:ShlB/FhaC/HecB family hemolysin secretion/activation protein n=1 Tax=Limnohabitans curvus TaxID=323423 RepID=UPI0014744FE5|nr:ShlB/FhaC/HecB family hemolysin secretion/activation protein [Limnohabitans curvus]